MAQITKDTMIGELLRDQEQKYYSVLVCIAWAARLPRWRQSSRLLWCMALSRRN